jgi:hypothetical protein
MLQLVWFPAKRWQAMTIILWACNWWGCTRATADSVSHRLMSKSLGYCPERLKWSKLWSLTLLSKISTQTISNTPHYPARMENWVCLLCEKTHRETQYRVKTKYFCFSYCVGVFLENTADWRVKDIWYIYCNVITGYCMTPVWGRNMGSTPKQWLTELPNGITNLFLNNFIKMVHFLRNFLLGGWEFQKLGYWINRSLLHIWREHTHTHEDNCGWIYKTHPNNHSFDEYYLLECNVV